MLASMENVYKVFNGEELLKDINLTIENTDRIGLVGINGCGKTTLLSILTGRMDFDKTPDGKGTVTSVALLKGYVTVSREVNGESYVDEYSVDEVKIIKNAYVKEDKEALAELKGLED